MDCIYNTIQYNTIQYNTIQYNTIQYNTIQHNTIQYNTIQYNTIQYNTIQYNIPVNKEYHMKEWITKELTAVAVTLWGPRSLQGYLLYAT